MRKRIGALIIQNKKLLLVTRPEVGYYWTPGGTVEKYETDQETLERELGEELMVKLKSSKFYIRMKYPLDNVSSTFYLAKIHGRPQPNNEVSTLIWYSKKDFENQQPPISSWLIGKVIPKLIEDGYL